jgi:hypothetical protein
LPVQQHLRWPLAKNHRHSKHEQRAANQCSESDSGGTVKIWKGCHFLKLPMLSEWARYTRPAALVLTTPKQEVGWDREPLSFRTNYLIVLQTNIGNFLKKSTPRIQCGERSTLKDFLTLPRAKRELNEKALR